MAGTTSLHSDGDFSSGWWLDWGQAPAVLAGQPPPNWPVDLLSNRSSPRQAGPICPPDIVYALQGRTVTVTGRQVELRFVGNLFSCNVCEGDAVLVAACSPLPWPPRPENAPIAVRFKPGVRAAGFFVAAGSGALAGATFRAVLWARLLPMGQWEQAIAVGGTSGPFLAPGIAREAPFLGVQAPAGNTIAEVRLDVVPDAGQQVDQVAVSHLYGLG